MYGTQLPTGIPGVDDRDMRNAFRMIDTDRDGQITLNDLRKFLDAIGEKATDAEIVEMIRMADLGQDGAVHLSEFCDLFRPLKEDGSSNDVYGEASRIMSGMRLDVRKSSSTYSPDEILKRFVSRLPGSVTGRPFIKRDALRDVISRWKTSKVETVREREFYDLLRIKKNDNAERAFAVMSSNGDAIDIKTFILIIGVFVAAPCDERVDFACRILDEANTGMLIEDQIEKLVGTNCIGIKTDLRSRIERIMRDSDANSMVSRKHLIELAKSDPGVLFPVSRVDFPYS